MANTKTKLTEDEAERALDAVYPMSLITSPDGKIIQSLLQIMSEHISNKAIIDDYVATGDIVIERHGNEIHILRCICIIDEQQLPRRIAAKLFPSTNGGDKKP